MQERIKALTEEITSNLPQVPFVVDTVAEALEWYKEYKTESAQEVDPSYDIISTLEALVDIQKYIRTTSDKDFFKTHILIGAILSEIPGSENHEKFAKFVTPSNANAQMVKALRVDTKQTEERGCFNTITMHLCELARSENPDERACMVCMLIKALHELKSVTAGMVRANVKAPVTPMDYIMVLGYAYVIANIRMAQVPLADKAREVLNEMSIILNNDVAY